MTVRILLAEDDGDDQQLFCDFLSHRTDIVLMPATENGEELLEALEKAEDEELPDIIILDQNMPKLNGLQTLAAIKINDRYAHLPVVIYSTYMDEQLISKSKEAGADLALTKPVSRKGYDEMINGVLKLLS